MNDLKHKLKTVQFYLQKEAKRIIGIESLNFYKASFRNQGFTDNSLSKWSEVKRRKNPKTKGAAKTRKILTGDTKALSDSLEYQVTTDGAQITSDVVYSQIHNQGGKAGRNLTTDIPKRPFVGKSEDLNRKLQKVIEDDLNQILNP